MKNRALSYIGKRLSFDAHFAFRSGFWLILGHLVGIVAALATSYAFANFVTPETYGQYKYIISLGVLLSAFSLTGTSIAITQAAAKNLVGFYKYIRKINLRYSLFISLISIIGAIYYYLNENITLAAGLILIALFQPLFNNSSLFYSHLQGKERFQHGTIAHTIKALFTTTATLISVLLTENVTILLTTYFLSYIFINYTLQWFFIKNFGAIPKDTSSFQSLLSYTKHSSVQNIISGISNQLDKILIFQNIGAAELAIYTFATALPDQYKGVTKTVDTMLLPRFSKYSTHSIRAKIFHKSILYFAFLLACVLLYILAAPYIFTLLFPQYQESILLSQIYVTGMIFGVGGIPLAALKSEMDNRKLYNFNLYSSLFQIVSLLIMLPLWGLIGAVLARVAYRFFVCVISYMLYYRNNHI